MKNDGDFAEMAARGYATAVEAMHAIGQRLLAYNKAIYDVLAEPFPNSSSPETIYREALGRASKISDLTVAELQQQGADALKQQQELAARTARWRETLAEGMRSSMEGGTQSVAEFRRLAERQLEEFAKAAEEFQKRAGSGKPSEPPA